MRSSLRLVYLGQHSCAAEGATTITSNLVQGIGNTKEAG